VSVVYFGIIFAVDLYDALRHLILYLLRISCLSDIIFIFSPQIKYFVMRKTSTFKGLLIVAAILIVSPNVKGQVHPLSFGIAGTATLTNWYKDYVGVRLTVTAPATIAGDVQNSPAGKDWPNIRDTDLINVPIVMPPSADSCGTSAFAPGSMTGKICVLWRGPISGAVLFSDKAARAQAAGALACVIINEYPGQGPFAPGYTSGTITIPVFMIGNLDGIAIAAQYNTLPANTVKMTITPWGQGLARDLGFVPQGTAIWHDNVIPAYQLVSSGNPMAYYSVDGAFVANFGSSNGKNVSVTDTLSFSPAEGGPAAVLHTGVSTTLGSFPSSDSIYSFFSPTEYNFTATSGKGRYDLTYTIASDSVDQFPGDNRATYSFYTSDSVYSKGRYDLTNQAPIRSVFESFGTGDFLSGSMYYVAHGGAAISSVQFSIANKANSYGQIGPIPMNIFVFKWTDGSNSQPMDSVVENGELSLVSLAAYQFDKPTDTSEVTFTQFMGDPLTGLPPVHPIILNDNSWYYVAVEVLGGYFLGCDGLLNPYPRIYGRYHSSNHNFEYSSIEWGGDYNGGTNPLTGVPATANFPCANTQSGSVNGVDSFNFGGMKGLIPAVALIVNNTPDTTHTGVKTVTKSFADVSLSPNPAKDYLNVSLVLDQPATNVTYTIIDGNARFVRKEVHSNVLQESYSLSTASLPSGDYYLVINADKNVMARKFVVVR
jgi:PA domain-containing protein/type IX secretion system substrate protein